METQFETPVLFLIFNRPEQTQIVFDRIKSLKPVNLYIAADGPRADKPGEYDLCQQTRKITSEIDWPCHLKTLFRPENLGCGKAISSALNWFFENVEYGIILEDDCLPDISFFQYCEENLIKYKDDGQIMSIGGNNFQNGIKRGEGSYYFSNYPHQWGWATWRRAWKHYDFDMPDIDTFLRSGINRIFKSKKEVKYWTKKLMLVINNKINTWDYQWFYTIWKNNGYSITPNCNLVINIGFRNNATHTFLRDSIKENDKLEKMTYPIMHPSKKIEHFADLTTYENILGYSSKRLLRLYKQNNFIFLIRYIIKR